MRRHARMSVAACLAATVGIAHAGAGVWSTSGPEGGDVAYLTADPLLPDVLLASTRGGVFRSVDAGANWTRFESGIDFAFPYGLETASTASTSYLAPDARRLFRSDGGGAWMPTGLGLAGSEYLSDLSLRPGSGQHLAVLSTSALRVSSDGGASFVVPAGAGLPATPPDFGQVDYATATRLYLSYTQLPAGGTTPLYRSDDGGANWIALGALPGGFYFAQSGSGALEAAPSDPDRVYLSVASGLYTSSDGGANWTACGAGPVGGGRLRVESGDADRVWLAGNRGVYSSADACASWTLHTSGLSADGARTDSVAAVALAAGFPADDRVWVGTVHGGAYRSDDAGASFVPINSGLISTNIRAIAPHPVDPLHLLAGYGDAFLPAPAIFRSVDGAASWARANTGLRATQIRGITIDPTTAATPATTHVYAVGSSRPSDEAPSPTNTDGGIYKSLDGGSTWSTIDNGLPITLGGARFIGTVRNLVLDPRSCASPPPSGACSSGPLQTAYVTASGRPNFTTGAYTAARVYRSTDAGANWSPSEAGLPSASTLADPCFFSQIAVPLVIDPSDSDTLYLGLALSYDLTPGCPVPAIPNGIFKSTDAGASWVHSSVGLPRLGGPGSSQWSVLALAVDPVTPSTLYAGAYETTASTTFHGRVFKSLDAGATWFETSVGIAGQDVRALLVDPADPDIVYAGTGGSLVDPSGVYRSEDGGLTWNSFSIGLPADAATALAFDPHDADRLLAGTPAGLWEYTRVPDPDADGASTAIENAAPNGGDGDGNGTPDAQESNVASFPGASSVLRGAAEPMITLEVEPVVGTCARINNAHALPQEQFPADVARGVAATAFARGLLRFELPDCARARVIVTFHGADHADRDWTWRNYGPQIPGDITSFAWYDFAGARKLGAGVWELTLDAAAQGNYRDSSDSLLFVGAPGFLGLGVFADGFE